MTTSATNQPSAPLPWADIDHVLLDMDGTLLDLHFDNVLWKQLLPQHFATARGVELEHAEQTLFDYMATTRGQLLHYSLDHWSEFSGVDLINLHWERDDLIRFRPGSIRFLAELRAMNKAVILATNADRSCFGVKDQITGLSQHLDDVASSEDFGAPKESVEFWHALHAKQPFDPQRTLFVDDNEAVLDSAATFGIRHLLCVNQPDLSIAPRTDLRHPATNNLAHILPPAVTPNTGSPTTGSPNV